MEHDDLVTVYTLQDSVKAEIIRNFLESEGIKCRLDDQNQAGFSGIFEIGVLVRAEDADAATKLIHAHLHEEQE
jgi:hypothetical protein